MQALADSRIAVATSFAVVLFGCGGHSPPDATANSQAPVEEVVEISTNQVVPWCGAGAAHPNVCCEPAAYESPKCVERPGEPFRPCDPGWLTFPDTRTCCSLDGGTTCTQTAGEGGVASDGSSTGACFFPCGPGGYLPNFPPPGSDAGTDSGFSDALVVPQQPNCTDPSADPYDCYACCSGVPAEICDAIVGSGGLPPYCSDPCPEGWQVPSGGQIDVCCRASDGGAPQCFSRANVIAPAPIVPGPPPPAAEAVDPSVLVDGNISACPAGSAHPNVCCSPVQPGPECVEFPDAPFFPCEATVPQIIYPDPRACCPLDGSGGCTATPPSEADGGSDGLCYEPCGPGGLYEANPAAGPQGQQCCYGISVSKNPGIQPPSAVCPSSDCDGAPCAEPQCGACPAGWDLQDLGRLNGWGLRASDLATQELCCQAGDGGTLCFSQADRIVTPATP